VLGHQLKYQLSLSDMVEEGEVSARSSYCPALLAAGGLACGILLGAQRAPSWWVLIPAVPLAWFALSGRRWSARWPGTASALVLLALGGWWWHPARGSDRLAGLASAGANVHLVGTVAGPVRSHGTRCRFELSVQRWGTDSLSTHRVTGRLLVAGASVGDLRTGDTVALQGRVRLPRGHANPGLFDYRGYLANRGVVGELRPAAGQLRVVSRAPPLSLGGVLGRIREASTDALSARRLTDSYSLLPGLLLGQRWMVASTVDEAFESAGLAHVMAISGLHVGFVAAFLFPLLRALRLGRKGAALGTAVGLVAYAAVTGGRPSVVRATVMACVLIAAAVAQRSWRPMNSLGVAAIIILAVRPRSPWDVGFQLSFLATAAILGLSRPVLDRFSRRSAWSYVVAALVVSCGAQAGVAPILARCFNTIHPVAPLANLVVIPLVGLGVALGFTTLLAASLSPWLADMFAHANLVPLELSVGIARWLGRLPCASVAVSSPGLPVCAFYYVGLVVAVLAVRYRRRAMWCTAFICLALAVGLWWFSPTTGGMLELTVLDVGEGDSILIRVPGGESLLIDGGLRSRYTDMGHAVVVPYLRSEGVRRLGALLLTHAHNDHVGGLPSVIREIRVDRAYDTGFPHTSWSYRLYLQCLEERSIPLDAMREGDTIPLGDARLLVLYPRESDLDRVRRNPRLGLNAVSVVTRLLYGRIAILLTGDAEEATERLLLERKHTLASPILKVGHHGAATSSTADFLEAVSAEVAIISAGAANRFGHPHEEALGRLSAAGCRIYRTDVHGAVVVTTDGRSYRVKTTRPVSTAAAG
jgi:competence protein ComEC